MMKTKLIILLLIMLVSTAGVRAQEATVKRMEALPFEVIPATARRVDLNGEPCALVHVEVLADDVKFEGNVIGSVEHGSGEYRVYLSPGTKMMRIKSGSFLPLMLYFTDYGISGVQPNVAYALTLQLPQASAAQPSIEQSPYTEAEESRFESFKENDKWGLKDKNGKVIIPAMYDWISMFSERLARVEINGKYGFIDSSNRMVIPAKYDAAYIFSEGLAAVAVNGKYGFINKTGQFVIPPAYDDANAFRQGVSVVTNGEKYGMIDSSGHTLLPTKYDWIYFVEGVGRVSLNNKYGFVNNKGHFIMPIQYEDAGFYSEGLAAVKKNGKWGYIDKSGNMVISPKYTQAHSFSDGTAVVEYKGKIGTIDADDNFTPCRIEPRTITISGTITDEEGEPLIGCTVMTADRKKGVATDLDGKYRLTVQTGEPVIVSYVGFKEKAVIVTGPRVDVQLLEVR